MVLAFGAGVLSFLSPCVLSLVPVYLANIAGSEILHSGVRYARMSVLLHSLSFVVGFGTVFIILGTGAGLLGRAAGGYITQMRRLSGILLISLGVFTLLALKIPAFNLERRLSPGGGAWRGYPRSFITGAVFSLGWTPCVGPVLGGVLTLALSTETAGAGASLLAVYSLGLGLPFLIIGAFFEVLAPVLRRIHRYSVLIHLLSAFMLIIIGILVLTGKLALLSIRR